MPPHPVIQTLSCLLSFVAEFPAPWRRNVKGHKYFSSVSICLISWVYSLKGLSHSLWPFHRSDPSGVCQPQVRGAAKGLNATEPEGRIKRPSQSQILRTPNCSVQRRPTTEAACATHTHSPRQLANCVSSRFSHRLL